MGVAATSAIVRTSKPSIPIAVSNTFFTTARAQEIAVAVLKRKARPNNVVIDLGLDRFGFGRRCKTVCGCS